jgi:hypothetical protein
MTGWDVFALGAVVILGCALITLLTRSGRRRR